MTIKHLTSMLCITLFVLSTSALSARQKELEPLTAQGEKLLASYTHMLDALKKEIAAGAPKLDEQKVSAFNTAYTAVNNVPRAPNPDGLKMAPPTYANSNIPYAIAQSNAVIQANTLLKDTDAFLSGNTLDAQLIKCALLVDATPHGLAAFAQQGSEQEAVITKLLADESMMKRIMEMGGAFEGKYGQSMEIYHAILKASDRAKEGVLQQLALGVSLEHPEGHIKVEGKSPAEAMVEMYLSYEKAYLDKHLDPAFGTYRDWEYRFIFPHRSVQDATWLRRTMRNYRPDHIIMDDYKWRYVRIVKTDVPYTSGVDRSQWDDLPYTHMQKIFFRGGICGPRAFMGKLSTAAFGIPTRGARQTGHAAMSHWTPDGWTTVLGAHWTHNRWRGRTGRDFFLETQTRSYPADYRKVLRSQWLGDALGESRVNGMKYGTGGGLWHGLAHYRKLAIVEDNKVIELAPTGEELGESNDEAVVEAFPQIEIPDEAKKITVAETGEITVPVAACKSPASTEKVRFMHSMNGGIQAHYNLAGNRPELLRYTVEAPAAGKYTLSAKVVTVALNGNFLLRLNRRTMVDVEIPYTVGEWGLSTPIDIDLKEGRNSLQFTIKAPHKGLTIKEFVLTPVG